MSKTAKWIMAVVTVVVLILAVMAVCALGFLLPYDQAISGFGADKSIQLYQREDGSTEIFWPRGIGTDEYFLEILDPKTHKTLYSKHITGEPCCTVPALSKEQRTIRIRTVAEYTVLFEKIPLLRMGEDTIEITDCFISPQITEVSWSPNPETGNLEVELAVADGCTIQLYELSGSQPTVPVKAYTDRRISLSFGEGTQWPMPDYGESYTYAFDAYREGEGYSFYGLKTDPITLTREDLLGTDLTLTSENNGNNTFTLTWNETKGDYYELQCRGSAGQKWKTALEVVAGSERTYTTEAMEPYASMEYRVLAWCSGEEEPLAKTEAVTVQMGAAVVYSTIWPIQNLKVYTDVQKTDTLGTAGKGTAFCVLALEEGMFRIRFKDGFGYIDSNYCMINLAECMGDLCTYKITSSYESAFKIHEYEIPNITDTIITGYELVQMSEANYLVPLLYPVVKKLEQAALAAKELGYTLKIYESFRPQKATQFLYDEAVAYSQELIPVEAPAEGETGSTVTETPEPITFAMFMTDNGRYAMNYFLAKGQSRHNQGVALDLTLENADGEVAMQTAIHDLSWYSETAQNNKEAKLLAEIMTGAGFKGLVSEWWHFQDNDALNNLKPAALFEGVSPECWMADENGWRYRTANGSYLQDCEETVDGTRYTFDHQGYAIEK